MGLKSIYTVLDVFDLGPLNLQTSALSKCFSSPTELGKYIMELVCHVTFTFLEQVGKIVNYYVSVTRVMNGQQARRRN